MYTEQELLKLVAQKTDWSPRGIDQLIQVIYRRIRPNLCGESGAKWVQRLHEGRISHCVDTLEEVLEIFQEERSEKIQENLNILMRNRELSNGN